MDFTPPPVNWGAIPSHGDVEEVVLELPPLAQEFDMTFASAFPPTPAPAPAPAPAPQTMNFAMAFPIPNSQAATEPAFVSVYQPPSYPVFQQQQPPAPGSYPVFAPPAPAPAPAPAVHFAPPPAPATVIVPTGAGVTGSRASNEMVAPKPAPAVEAPKPAPKPAAAPAPPPKPRDPPPPPHKDTPIEKLRWLLGMPSENMKKVRREQQLAERSLGGFSSIDEHLLDFHGLAQRFSQSGIDPENPARSKGLDPAVAKTILEKNGPNMLTPPKGTPAIIVLIKQFFDPFMILLQMAGILSFIAYGLDTAQPLNLYVGIILYVLTLGSCLFTFKQEHSSSSEVMNTFKKMLPPQCLVLRGGQELKVDAGALVNGDLAIVRGGDKVPADLRLIQCSGLKVECAQITGESVPVATNVKPSEPGHPSNEAINLCLSGSLAQEGSAIGIVIRTGDRTVIGQIAGQASDTDNVQSSLQVELMRFVKFIAVIAFSTAAVFFAIGLGRQKGHNVLNLVINGFLITVIAFVPEGLPATVTTLLKVVAGRLSEKNVFCKKLAIVEALGSTSMICSDKTGTLTQNVMTVVAVWTQNDFFFDRFEVDLLSGREGDERRSNAGAGGGVEGRRRSMETRRSVDVKQTDLRKSIDIRSSIDKRKALSLLPSNAQQGTPIVPVNGIQHMYVCACICNNAAFEGDEPGVDWSSTLAIQDRAKVLDLRGSPSEIALLRWCESALPSKPTRAAYETVFEIPFNSDNKWHLKIVVPRIKNTSAPTAEREYTLFLKGAPERIVTYCTRYLSRGREAPADASFKENFDAAYNRFGSAGQRVLALSRRTFFAPTNIVFTYEAGERNFPLEELVFIGLAAIADPPRPGVAEAVLKCQTAGIRVAMVTGDHRLTACAIARQVNILPGSSAEMMGEDMPTDNLNGLSPCIARYAKVNWAAVVGTSVDGLTQKDWDHLMEKDSLVFCRVTPNHKLMIVEQCQMHDEIVAVTGDGVNDSPALKRANIGVSMGLNGSDVAKEASDVILMDDNFASIVMAIEQGRLVFDNLMKTIAYTVAHTMPEVIPILLTLALGFPAGLSTLQILSIDLVSELGPAVSLAYEEMEADIMNQPPRDTKKDRLVTGAVVFHSYIAFGLLEAAAGLIAYVLVFSKHHVWSSELVSLGDSNFNPGNNTDWTSPHDPLLVYNSDEQFDIQKEAATAWYICIVIGQFWHIWTVKSRRVSMIEQGLFKNSVTIFGASLAVAIVILESYTPGIQYFFSSYSVDWVPWVIVAILGVIMFSYNEGRKKFAGPLKDGPLRRLFMW